MNTQDNRRRGIEYLRAPAFPQAFEEFFTLNEDDSICGHCALGALAYTIGATPRDLSGGFPHTNFGLELWQIDQIIDWNDKDKLTLEQIADKLEETNWLANQESPL